MNQKHFTIIPPVNQDQNMSLRSVLSLSSEAELLKVINMKPSFVKTL